MTRAAFLKLCGLAIAGAGVDARLLASVASVSDAMPPSERGRLSLGEADAALFCRHLGTAFDVRRDEGGPVRLLLKEVAERPITRNVEQFSLIFHAPAGRPLPDGIHLLQHRTLGAFELFIAPVGAASAARTVYQACFSRHGRGGNGMEARRLDAPSLRRT